MNLITPFSNNYFYDDLRFLDVTEVPVILVATVFLFIAFYKVKYGKRDSYSSNESINPKNELNFKSYDVLMQPKKTTHGSLKPLTNFTLPLTFKEFLLSIVLFVFFYLVFTNTI